MNKAVWCRRSGRSAYYAYQAGQSHELTKGKEKLRQAMLKVLGTIVGVVVSFLAPPTVVIRAIQPEFVSRHGLSSGTGLLLQRGSSLYY